MRHVVPHTNSFGERVDLGVGTRSHSAKTHKRRFTRGPLLGAVVALIAVLGFSATACTPQDIATIAVNNNFDPAQRACALRIIQRESNYQAGAISPGGANIGLFQINKVHQAWIAQTYGYTFGELTDANKNAQVARGLSNAALSYYGDQWQPWRVGGQVIRGGGCPA